MRQQLIEESKEDNQHINLFKQEQLNHLEKEKRPELRENDEFRLGSMVGHKVQRPWYMKAKQPDEITRQLAQTKDSRRDREDSDESVSKRDKKLKKGSKHKKDKKARKEGKKERKRELKRKLKELGAEIAIEKEVERWKQKRGSI